MAKKSVTNATTSKEKGSKERYTPEQVSKVLIHCNGNNSHAAEVLGCDRVTIHRYRQRHPECEEAAREGWQQMKDSARQGLVEAIGDKQAWAICFALKHTDDDFKTKTHHEVTINNPPPAGLADVAMKRIEQDG